MSKSDLIPLVFSAALLSACAQPEPIYQTAGQYRYPAQSYAYPVQRQDPIRDTSQQLSSVQQILQQIQNLKSTIGRF